jgi:hypothetical protein
MYRDNEIIGGTESSNIQVNAASEVRRPSATKFGELT